MNVFDLMAKISLDKSEYDNGLKDADREASSFGTKIGNGLATAAKIGAAAIAGASTAVGAMVKQSVAAYGEYEQLIGGAQLMFGEGYDFVAAKAKTAYKDVQLSQNEYLKQVNGFAVGLTTALGGNGQAAAELANDIVKAEADIVAATGNSAESVQNAFNGIMRGNYMMLDNLGLGIKGTKAGMQEVIDTVNKYNEAQGQATNYTIENTADAQKALVQYVEMQGMAGYASAEAAGTIQGSMASVKAAWEDLLSSMAQGTSGNRSILNFVEVASATMETLLPTVEKALFGVSKLVSSVAPIIARELPNLIDAILPNMLSAAVSLVTGIATALPDILTILTNAVMNALPDIIDAIIQIAPQLVLAAMTITTQIVAALPEIITLITDKLPELVTQIADVVSDNAPAFLAAGVALVTALGDGILSMVGLLDTDMTKDIDSVLKKAQEKLPQFLEKGVAFIEKMALGLLRALPTIVNNLSTIISKLFSFIVSNLPQFLEKGADIVIKIALGLIKALPQIIQSLGTMLTSMLTTIVQNLPKFIESGMKIIAQLIVGLVKAIPSIISTIGQLAIQIVNMLMATNWISIGKNIVEGLINGVKAMGSVFINAIVDLGKKALENIKSFFGIHSPSTVMRDQVGKQLALGVAEGVTKNESKAVKAMQEMGEKILSAAEKNLSNYKVYHDMSLQDEAEYWNEIRQKVAEGTQARIDADKKYFDAQKKYEEALKDLYKKLKEDEEKRQENIKKLKEKAYDVTKKFNEKYSETYNKMLDDLEKAQDKYNNGVAKLNEKLKENISKTEEDLAKDISKINEDMQKDIDKINEKYNQTIESRSKAIMGFTSLFDAVKKDEAIGKDILIGNLKDQVASLEDWDKQLDSLADRIGQENPLMQAIQSMGISSTETLKELNKMTDKELKEYVELYNKKQEIANARAIQENAALRQQSDAEIEAIQKDGESKIKAAQEKADELIKQYREQAEKDRKALQEELEKTTSEVKAEAEHEMDVLQRQYTEDMKELTETLGELGEGAGKSMMDGMAEGIQTRDSYVTEVARAAARRAYRAAMAELDIHSPSKKFAWLGRMIDEGFIQGIKQGAVKIESQIHDTFGMNDLTSSIKTSRVANVGNRGYNQIINITSPTALTPYEVARQTRNATKNMVLAMGV